ncbi:hypothetical protein [Dictyobacter formicarum]|uniref:Uncharacterized protein n=1 Tax=Dictyobacter formicarum TaxID=2778368 RepID=A0ABQ3VBY3_9CHLR|nr:hypothetical protein [Dictyobacter formicarum]GHO82991.1 hypothetical protein KSZ_09970 [Dictyobacter formicarum]
MGRFDRFIPFKSRQPGQVAGAQTAAAPPQKNSQQQPPDPNTGPLDTASTSGLQNVDGESLNLVNYSPAQLMQHVENTMSTVHFGMSLSHRFMENVAELWSVIGPMVLLLGTSGEVFAFIWQNTNNPEWWVGMSILATVIVLEATFMVVSYKAATIRNRAEMRPGGPSDLDKAKLKRYKITWFVLGFGVGAGQVAFLLFAMNARVNGIVWLATFAIVRTVMTLASDFYTAFVHEEKPTDGEQAKQKQQQRAQLAQQLLHQKSAEVTIINKGILELQRAHTEADIEQDSLHTELQMKRLENKNRIETLKSMQDQANMFNRLGTGVMRALFDPEMDDDQRQKLLGTLQGFMSVGNQLPPPHTTIEEEDI